MYIQDWDTFAEQAEALYRSDPLKVRYVLKYRHCDGKAVLKVTDDKTALQYKTDQVADVKKIEKLNLLFFTLMGQGSDAEIPVDEPMDTTAAPQVQELSQKMHTNQQSKKGQKRRKG
ncbi:hypothetical protein ABBQ38_011287 [Trebouxia sp. C0009 RCD-2024]